jgi:hypothetical protein
MTAKKFTAIEAKDSGLFSHIVPKGKVRRNDLRCCCCIVFALLLVVVCCNFQCYFLKH